MEHWLSGPRFQPYLAAKNGDRSQALELYEWNTCAAASFMHDLSHLEIAVRNAYDRAWTASRTAAGHWTQDALTYFPPNMRINRATGVRFDANAKQRDKIAAAVQAAGGHSADPGKVIAELTFGFWRYLTISANERTLWRPFLHRAVRSGTRRQDVDDRMNRLLQLRNRVAHHEPLLALNLSSAYQDVLDLLKLISPDVHDFVQRKSTWTHTLAQRP